MKTSILTLSLLLGTSAGVEPPAGPAPEPALPLRARLTDEAIRQAVRETLAERDARAGAAGAGEVLSGDGYRAFARTFSEAKKPSCLGPDATRHQPASFSTKNWNIGLGGLFVLPFWATAIVRGKCN